MSNILAKHSFYVAAVLNNNFSDKRFDSVEAESPNKAFKILFFNLNTYTNRKLELRFGSAVIIFFHFTLNFPFEKKKKEKK